MKVCAFVGPSLRNANSSKVVLFPPAAMGSVFLAVEAGFQSIAIIDGVFGNVPAIWHKEIVYAICRGVRVIGGGSMGAIRAAELNEYGMEGAGLAFRLFRRGLPDDDEVAVIHAPQELNFLPLSEPMINIRYNLRCLRKRGLVTSSQEAEAIRLVKKEFFPSRTIFLLESILESMVDHESLNLIKMMLQNEYFDVKARDAEMVLKLAQTEGGQNVDRKIGCCFPSTHHWRTHFEREVSSLPPLVAWSPKLGGSYVEDTSS